MDLSPEAVGRAIPTLLIALFLIVYGYIQLMKIWKKRKIKDIKEGKLKEKN